MKATVTQLQGLTFAAKGESGHWVMLDGPEALGGAGAASRPMEFFLFGLAGCAGADLASMLAKQRVQVEAFDIEVEAERAETHPKVFTKIHVTFLLRGHNLSPKRIERLIDLTRTKYCPAWAMLQQAVEITSSYEIHDSE